MDYEFSHDILGKPVARFSSGHEVVGRWLADELSDDLSQLNSLLKTVKQLESHNLIEHNVQGVELNVHLDQHEVEFHALVLSHHSEDELPEDTHYDDGALYAGCGLQDFKRVLLSWKSFITHL